MLEIHSSVNEYLRRFRKQMQLSQLELSLRLGVSQRHVSFVESGRSKASRSLLINWMKSLEVPLVQRNELLFAAGYAPAYSATEIDDPGMFSARTALNHLLNAHNPSPAFVLDDDWNVQALNDGAVWLARTLVPALVERQNGDALNLLDLFTDSDGLAPLIVNIDDVGPRFLSMLRMEAVMHESLASRVRAFEEMLSVFQNDKDRYGKEVHEAPALTTIFASPFGELSFMSMFTTFGTPVDITLASLRVEHLFPADEFTRSVLNSEVLSPP